MKFQVIGQNRASGARMTLEFEAESKAAAERKATIQGMSVHRVIDISDGYPAQSHEPNPRAGNVYRSGSGRLRRIIIFVILLIIVWWVHAHLMQQVPTHR